MSSAFRGWFYLIYQVVYLAVFFVFRKLSNVREFQANNTRGVQDAVCSFLKSRQSKEPHHDPTNDVPASENPPVERDVCPGVISQHPKTEKTQGDSSCAEAVNAGFDPTSSFSENLSNSSYQSSNPVSPLSSQSTQVRITIFAWF